MEDQEVKSLTKLYALLSQPINKSDYRVAIQKTKSEVMRDAETLRADHAPGDFTDYRL